jgi:hypothetical protein
MTMSRSSVSITLTLSFSRLATKARLFNGAMTTLAGEFPTAISASLAPVSPSSTTTTLRFQSVTKMRPSGAAATPNGEPETSNTLGVPSA